MALTLAASRVAIALAIGLPIALSSVLHGNPPGVAAVLIAGAGALLGYVMRKGAERGAAQPRRANPPVMNVSLPDGQRLSEIERDQPICVISKRSPDREMAATASTAVFHAAPPAARASNVFAGEMRGHSSTV